MAGATTYDRIKADVLTIIARIPEARLATHGAIGRHLGVDPRHIVNVMANLDDGERASIAWWRVVADGGAIGRHALRAEQIAKLKGEGVPVAPVGIVMELGERSVRNFDTPIKTAKTQSPPSPGVAPSRSRRMKSHPATIPKRSAP